MKKLSRRRLLKYGIVGTAGAIAAPWLIPSGVLGGDGKPGANQRITVGVIGVGGRARMLIDQLPEQGRVVAVADPFLGRCQEAAKAKKANWRMHQDYRKLLDEKGIDALIIATPDHNRALPCILACQAGKDIYAEKPLSLTIREGRAMVQAVRKYRRVLQVGSQQRSMAMNRIASQFVSGGGLGKITRVKAFNYASPDRIPNLPTEPIPADLNWDVWLGQAEFHAYNSQLAGPWRSWWDYSGGAVTNMGGHGLDQIQWALAMDETGPVEVWPITPGEKNGKVSYRYANGTQVDLEYGSKHGPDLGAIFIGEKGKIEINRNKFTTNPKNLIKELPPESEIVKWHDETALWQAKYHMENWMDCIQSREKPVADVEIGHRSVTVCHLCNIARQVARKITWDPEKEQIVGDEEANKLLGRPCRKGYELPDVT
jgi:predicted dehydrogenase